MAHEQANRIAFEVIFDIAIAKTVHLFPAIDRKQETNIGTISRGLRAWPGIRQNQYGHCDRCSVRHQCRTCASWRLLNEFKPRAGACLTFSWTYGLLLLLDNRIFPFADKDLLLEPIKVGHQRGFEADGRATTRVLKGIE